MRVAGVLHLEAGHGSAPERLAADEPQPIAVGLERVGEQCRLVGHGRGIRLRRARIRDARRRFLPAFVHADDPITRI